VTLFNRGTHPDPFADRVERLRGDRTTPDLERATSGRTFDAVVDFAAYVGDDVTRAIDALRGRVGHYVFISTGQVYLVRADRPTRPDGARESDYDGPVMARPDDERGQANWDYGSGKRACEDALVSAFARERFPSTRIRIPIVNGELDYQRRLDEYLYRMLDGGPILVPGGGASAMRHVYGDDVARAIVSLLGDPRTHGEAYNLAHAETPTLVDVLRTLARRLGAKPELVAVEPSAVEAAGIDPSDVSPFSTRWMSFLDPARAQRELGFRATPIDEALGRIVASFAAHLRAEPPQGLRHRARELEIARTAGKRIDEA
jgi:nucleoside-diphosphate-sugar epimerase